MKIFSIFSISKILPSALVILLLPVGIYFFYSKINIIGDEEKVSFEKDLVDFVSQVNLRWYHGDIEGLWAKNKLGCSDIPDSAIYKNSEFLKCNIAYLKCWLSEPNGQPKKIKTKNHVFEADISSMKLAEKNSVIVNFLERNTKKSFSLKFERSCHQAYLPQKVYSSGPDPHGEDVWDNFGRDLYVDQYYVTNWDIKQWKSKSLTMEEKDILPALNLSLSERRKYCFYRGKKLLQNHVFEAASFYPAKYKDGYVFKSKYPWAKVDKLERLKKAKSSDCEKLYSLECAKENFYKSFENFSPSWMGIYHSLGGHKEVFDNLFDRKANLKVSNFSLGRTDFWHENSKRASWDGKSLNVDSFNFTDFYSKKQSKISDDFLKGVAFRCMSIR